MAARAPRCHPAPGTVKRSDALARAGCLVLDLRLPGISGLELHRHLTAEGRSVPVIFMTAHDDPRTRESAMASGPVAYLTKPFPGRRLLDAVA
jgi:FixJ family two-component response regulator